MNNINLENWSEVGVREHGRPKFINKIDKKIYFEVMQDFVNMFYETNMNDKEKNFFTRNLLKNKINKWNIFLDPNKNNIYNWDVMIQVEYDKIDKKAKMLKEIYSDIESLK